MKTPKETAEKILAHIQQAADARIRPMMGEYLLYVNDTLVGQINHSDVFIKVTDFGETFAGDLAKESPYDGAKPMYVLPREKLDDLAWLKELLAGTAAQLKK